MIRLFLSLFQDLPALPRTIYIPGAVLLASYPILAVALGADAQGQAFATAFLLALAVRIGLGFEGMVRRMLMKFSAGQTVLLALAMSVLPLAVVAMASDPIWCQRIQSAFYVVIGGVFLLDVLRGRNDTAATLWPDREMQAYLPNLTRMMVIYNFSFLVLNETLISTLDASHWLLFWAVLPVIGHMVLRALVLTVINLDDEAHPV
ncbi:hypothetical protein [Tabrizicola sp.]|uniref:hypothetical protein n=1 Tax=Tabrizicola sp. TaxID=2005166 RepID=UPI002734BC77|nr:hypothetical protein [Tabrizicola sp.]MDP3648846.1 hypothetical protein [Paracoccaceae bacterium]